MPTCSIPMQLAVIVLGAYLLGSIPFGLLIGYARGQDIRQKGSRNIGATNAGRVLGKRFFYIVLLLDALKGLIPTVLAGSILSAAGLFTDNPAWACVCWLAVGFAAVAGHNWPCWLRFKGGKGVATSLGMVLAIYPYYTYPGVTAFVVWVIIVAATRYVSLGSISAAVVFLLTLMVLFVLHDTWRLTHHWPLLIFAAVMVTVLVVRHHSNIQRLLAGTENKFMSADER